MAGLSQTDEPLLPLFARARAENRAAMAVPAPVDELEVFREPGEVRKIDRIDPAGVLRNWWPEGEDDEMFLDVVRPYTAEFPGLAPATTAALADGVLAATLDQFDSAYFALVSAARPADVPTVSGWMGTVTWDEPEGLSAVLRSWEDRFGARLVQLGPGSELRLVVERPPSTLDAARPVAAELWAFADEWFAEAGNDRNVERQISEIVPRIINGPLWGFWWD
jgi:hypothetical protein